MDDNRQLSGKTPKSATSLKNLIAFSTLIILCIVMIAFFLKRSADITGPVSMGIHGWIAMGLGVVLSLAVGIGLMVLVFLSARRGFDDRVHKVDAD